jgi:hypothetical protein
MMTSATPIILLFVMLALSVAPPARASSTCASVLTQSQLRDFDVMFGLSGGHSPGLGDADDGDAVQGPIKRLTRKEIERASLSSHPHVVDMRNILSEQDVAPLKDWLKSNAPAEVPAWDMTMVGIAVPAGWAALTPDDFMRVMEQAGDAGRVRTTTLSTTDSESRAIGVTEHVARDSAGRLKFLWNYLYQVTLRGRLVIVPLALCQADVVTIVQNPPTLSADDDEELLRMESELARAWTVRDRTAVDRILAPEWSVTTPEGAKLFRGAVLAASFGSSDPVYEAMKVDDVTITQFGSAAVVRGRMTVIFAGTRQTITLRFTDFCIKRDRTWQVVASHQSRVLP